MKRPPWLPEVIIILALTVALHAQQADPGARTPGAEKIAEEVATLGWIVLTSKSAAGDHDLFLMRPDGRHRRNITNTPKFDEYGARFSPDGTRIIYRRLDRSQETAHDRWGEKGVPMIANTDGSASVPLGEEESWPWASWSPDGRQLACLYKEEGKIRIHDLETGKIVKELPSQGMFIQMFWAPDGKKVCGPTVIKGLGTWNIAAVDLATEELKVLTRVLNCTADWFYSSDSAVHSHRNPALGAYKTTMLQRSAADGSGSRLIYAEHKKHIYSGCMSPDDNYVLFIRGDQDGPKYAPLAIVRLADTPIVAEPHVEPDILMLQEMYPDIKSGPVLHLGISGFEPHWTLSEINQP